MINVFGYGTPLIHVSGSETLLFFILGYNHFLLRLPGLRPYVILAFSIIVFILVAWGPEGSIAPGASFCGVTRSFPSFVCSVLWGWRVVFHHHQRCRTGRLDYFMKLFWLATLFLHRFQ